MRWWPVTRSENKFRGRQPLQIQAPGRRKPFWRHPAPHQPRATFRLDEAGAPPRRPQRKHLGRDQLQQVDLNSGNGEFGFANSSRFAASTAAKWISAGRKRLIHLRRSAGWTDISGRRYSSIGKPPATPNGAAGIRTMTFCGGGSPKRRPHPKSSTAVRLPSHNPKCLCIPELTPSRRPARGRGVPRVRRARRRP